MTNEVHPHRKESRTPLTFCILSVSSTRGLKEDGSGDLIEAHILSKGHTVRRRQIVKDDVDAIRAAMRDLLAGSADLIVVDGGTGVTPEDLTIEAVRPMFDKEMTGFSNLFTQLSFDRIGSAAILSRACAGTIGRTAVFCIPGSPQACSLAMERIILPEAGHIVGHIRGRV